MKQIQVVNEKRDNWRRIAVKPLTGNKIDILVALINVSRAENDKVSLYQFVDFLVDAKWAEAKGRGLVFDNMLQVKDAPADMLEMPA